MFVGGERGKDGSVGKQRGRTRALEASSREAPQAAAITAGRRRCVFLPAPTKNTVTGRNGGENLPAPAKNTSTGRKTVKTLPAHPRNTVQGRETPGNVPAHTKYTSTGRETGEYIEKNIIFAVGH